MIQLTLTDQQAQIVSRACEFYARMRYGQFNELITETMEFDKIPQDKVEDFRHNAEKLLFTARTYLMPTLHGYGHSYGLGHDEVSDRAYDVYQVLRMHFGDTRTPFSYYDLPSADRLFNNDMLED